MTITQYTIEPWQLWHGTGDEIKVVASDSERTICDIVGDTDIDEAHGRLIAAAPELLQTLQETFAALRVARKLLRNVHGDTYKELFDAEIKARTTIRKARGE